MVRIVIALRALLLLALGFLPLHAAQMPMTGTNVQGFGPLEKATRDFMTLIHAEAATVAVSKDKQLLYSRGFGWMDTQKSKPVPPDALMRLASVTKPFTAAMVRKAIADKKLTLETKAFQYLGIKPLRGQVADPRLYSITVAQLLEHKGGWDRDQAFDPMFATRRIEADLKLQTAATPVNVIQYMLTKPLQFAPGERKSYSNFGYCVLGRVLEKATGMSYAQCLQSSLCQPLGITDLQLGRTVGRAPKEVYYPVSDSLFSLEVMDAHGGLIGSAPAVCKFLDHYWITGEPRLRGEYGNWIFFGSLPGTTTLARQRLDRLNVVVLLNGRRERTSTQDNDVLLKAVDRALDNIGKR